MNGTNVKLKELNASIFMEDAPKSMYLNFYISLKNIPEG